MLSSLLVQLCKMRTENEVGRGGGGPWVGAGAGSQGQAGGGLLGRVDLASCPIGLVVSSTQVCLEARPRLGAERRRLQRHPQPLHSSTSGQAGSGGGNMGPQGGHQCPGWSLPWPAATLLIQPHCKPTLHLVPSLQTAPLPGPRGPLQHQMVDFSLCLN